MKKILPFFILVAIILSGCATMKAPDPFVVLEQAEQAEAERPDSKKGMYWVSSIAELQTLDPTGASAPNQYNLIDGDAAILVSLSGTTTDMSVYIFDASESDEESSPDIIRPTNFTTGVWRMSKVTVASLAARPTADPGFTFYDSDGAGAEEADKEAAKLLANMSTTTEDAEVSDFALTFMNAGTRQNFFLWDGSEWTLTLGPQTDGWAGGDVANYEQIRFDFDTANDAEIGVSSPSGATKLNFGTLDMETTGYVSGQANLVPDTSGVFPLTVNAVNYGSDTGDADIPDGACNAAADVGNWVVLISSVADAYSLTSDDASNQFIITANAAALTAGNELDVDGTMVSVMCIAAELWKVTGYMGAIPTDGEAAD